MPKSFIRMFALVLAVLLSTNPSMAFTTPRGSWRTPAVSSNLFAEQALMLPVVSLCHDRWMAWWKVKTIQEMTRLVKLSNQSILPLAHFGKRGKKEETKAEWILRALKSYMKFPVHLSLYALEPSHIYVIPSMRNYGGDTHWHQLVYVDENLQIVIHEEFLDWLKAHTDWDKDADLYLASVLGRENFERTWRGLTVKNDADAIQRFPMTKIVEQALVQGSDERLPPAIVGPTVSEAPKLAAIEIKVTAAEIRTVADTVISPATKTLMNLRIYLKPRAELLAQSLLERFFYNPNFTVGALIKDLDKFLIKDYDKHYVAAEIALLHGARIRAEDQTPSFDDAWLRDAIRTAWLQGFSLSSIAQLAKHSVSQDELESLLAGKPLKIALEIREILGQTLATIGTRPKHYQMVMANPELMERLRRELQAMEDCFCELITDTHFPVITPMMLIDIVAGKIATIPYCGAMLLMNRITALEDPAEPGWGLTAEELKELRDDIITKWLPKWTDQICRLILFDSPIDPCEKIIDKGETEPEKPKAMAAAA